MPLAVTHWHVPRLPKWLAVLFPVGLIIAGWGLAEHVSPLSAETGGAVTITRNGTSYVTTTRTVKRVVSGRVVHKPGEKVYVRVPVLIVRTDHRTIKVPAHNIPLRSAAATVAEHVPVTVTVEVPTTIFVPTTVTSTITETLPVVTTTITLPLTDGAPQ